MKYVIIGNSAAGIGCVEGIRQADPAGGITLVSGEAHHTYSRPLISYLMQGKTTEEKMKYRPDDFYEKNGVRVVYDLAERIDPVAKKVILKSGETLPYDRLLVGTGSIAFVPPMEGLEQVKSKFSFMTLEDARAVSAAINPQSRVLIVGAGLIGLKAAEALEGKVGSITMLDLSNRILPSILDEEGSARVQKYIESRGVHFLLSDSVERFKKNIAHLKSGSQVDFDILIIAVGVRPCVSLIKEAGGTVGRGITIDTRCQTSLTDVYAAGDCAECMDISCGQNRVLAILPNAYMQGECAGINMAGGEKLFDKAIPMNAIGFFGLHMITAGSYEGESILSATDSGYKRLFVRDNRLVGYILIGEVERAGIYTSLIREKTDLEGVDFEMLKKKPQLAAFSKSKRKQMLSNKV